MSTDYSYYREKAPKCPHCGTVDKMDDPLSDLYQDEAIVHLTAWGVMKPAYARAESFFKTDHLETVKLKQAS